MGRRYTKQEEKCIVYCCLIFLKIVAITWAIIVTVVFWYIAIPIWVIVIYLYYKHNEKKKQLNPSSEKHFKGESVLSRQITYKERLLYEQQKEDFKRPIQTQKSMIKFCNYCGMELGKEDKYCKMCGSGWQD